MDINFVSEILMLYERGERYWKRNAPEAREEFESIIALCEKRGVYPDHYLKAIYKLIEINTALDNNEKAAFYQDKFARLVTET